MTDMADQGRETAIRNVVRAWTKTGLRPDYHHAMQITLHQKWPVLANALQGLADAERDSAHERTQE